MFITFLDMHLHLKKCCLVCIYEFLIWIVVYAVYLTPFLNFLNFFLNFLKIFIHCYGCVQHSTYLSILYYAHSSIVFNKQP